MYKLYLAEREREREREREGGGGGHTHIPWVGVGGAWPRGSSPHSLLSPAHSSFFSLTPLPRIDISDK